MLNNFVNVKKVNIALMCLLVLFSYFPVFAGGNSFAGILNGDIKNNGKSIEKIAVCLYESPIQGQYGFFVTSYHLYQITPIDSLSYKDNKLFIYSKLANTAISGKINKKGFYGFLESGKKKYKFQQEVELTKSDKMPDWAKNVKHIIYKDGVYEAKTKASYYGHQPYCKVTVKNGRIVDVVFYEKNFKTNDVKNENYGKEYIEEFGEISYAGGQLSVLGGQTYRYRLILSQDSDNVDGVTGATSTFYRFKKVVNKALKDAIVYKKEFF